MVVTACSFAGSGPAVRFGARRAVGFDRHGQLARWRLDRPTTTSARCAQIGLNEVAYTYPKESITNYRVKIGDGDESIIAGGWNSGEDAGDVPAGLAGKVSTARWTEGNAKLKAPRHSR